MPILGMVMLVKVNLGNMPILEKVILCKLDEGQGHIEHGQIGQGYIRLVRIGQVWT